MDILALLQRQHREVEALFAAVQRATPHEKVALVGQLAEALTLHAAIEERWVYPLSRQFLDDATVVDHAEDAHADVHRRVSELLRTRQHDPALDVRVRELERLVRAHVEEEEQDFFPRLQRAGDMALEAVALSSEDVAQTTSELRRRGVLAVAEREGRL